MESIGVESDFGSLWGSGGEQGGYVLYSSLLFWVDDIPHENCMFFAAWVR